MLKQKISFYLLEEDRVSVEGQCKSTLFLVSPEIFETNKKVITISEVADRYC